MVLSAQINDDDMIMTMTMTTRMITKCPGIVCHIHGLF